MHARIQNIFSGGRGEDNCVCRGGGEGGLQIFHIRIPTPLDPRMSCNIEIRLTNLSIEMS